MDTKKKLTQEAWVEDVLNSMDNRTPLAVSQHLMNRLASIPNLAIRPKELYISRQRIWLAAASIALLIATSITTFQYKRTLNTNTNLPIAVYDSYFSYLNQL